VLGPERAWLINATLPLARTFARKWSRRCRKTRRGSTSVSVPSRLPDVRRRTRRRLTQRRHWSWNKSLVMDRRTNVQRHHEGLKLSLSSSPCVCLSFSQLSSEPSRRGHRRPDAWGKGGCVVRRGRILETRENMRYRCEEGGERARTGGRSIRALSAQKYGGGKWQNKQRGTSQEIGLVNRLGCDPKWIQVPG
jgi:hypothetical protein